MFALHSFSWNTSIVYLLNLRSLSSIALWHDDICDWPYTIPQVILYSKKMNAMQSTMLHAHLQNLLVRDILIAGPELIVILRLRLAGVPMAPVFTVDRYWSPTMTHLPGRQQSSTLKEAHGIESLPISSVPKSAVHEWPGPCLDHPRFVDMLYDIALTTFIINYHSFNSHSRAPSLPDAAASSESGQNPLVSCLHGVLLALANN